MASGKIFVDVDEEIIFTVEKILNSPTNRVIVVIPESANLVASLISLKLLSRQIAKSDKLIVVVTEDSLGLKLSKQAGLVAKAKISDITPKVWIEAEELKKAFLEGRNKLKEHLVSKRKESNDYEIVEEKEEDIQPKDKENEKQEIKYTPAMGAKPRLDPKVVKLGEIAVLAGGDVEANSDFIGKLEVKPKIEDADHEKSAKDRSDDLKSKSDSVEKPSRITEESDSKAILGKDWSSVLPEDTPKNRRKQRNIDNFDNTSTQSRIATASSGLFAGAIAFFQDIKARIFDFYNTGDKRIKIGGTVVLVLILLYFLSSGVFASAKVTIWLSKANISVSESVKGQANAQKVDLENSIIPVREITVEETSSSSTDTTGNVKDGNHAKGLITLYNKKEKVIVLPAGTIIQNITTNLKYKITSSTSVSAAVIDGGGNINVGVKKDVPIEAASYGEKYNVSGTAKYKVASYTTDELLAQSFNDVEGGDTSEERAVAKVDITSMRDGLVDELKNTLDLELDQLLSADEVMLDDSVRYGDPKVETDKKVDEKADSVNVTVTLKATAYVVQKNDLKEFVAEAIKKSSEFNGEVDVNQLDDPDVTNVKLSGNNVSFTISSTGDIVGGATEDEIKANIAGKSPSQAQEYLDGLEGVEKTRLSVGPFYLPGFLKKVPSENKIEVDLRKSAV